MNPSLCATSCQDSPVDRFPYVRTYLPIYSTVRARFNGIESFASDTRQFMLRITKETLRPMCCERAFELATSEWHGSADDTTISIPFHRFRSMPSLRSDRWRLWLTGLYAKMRFLSRLYAVRRIAARHLRALLHYHYMYNSYDTIKRLKKLQKHNDLSYIEKDLNNAIFHCKYINAEIGIKNSLMMNNEYIWKLTRTFDV